MNNEFLFVYGTLRQPMRHPLHRRLLQYGESRGDAYMQGCLFEIAGYPGAVESTNSDHLVTGELYRINDSKRLFSILDDYEECSKKFPRPHEYERKIVSVYTIQDDSISAWAYIYRRPTRHRHKIPHGDYLHYLRLR